MKKGVRGGGTRGGGRVGTVNIKEKKSLFN